MPKIPPQETNRGAIKHAALTYLGKHPGEMVQAQDMADATGYTKKQLAHSIYQMRQRHPRLKAEIVVYQGGHTWKYLPQSSAMHHERVAEPEPEPEPVAASQPEQPPNGPVGDPNRYFEQIGTTSKDVVLVRGEDGTLFKLVELDI